jgi:ribonuclease HII
MKRPGPNHARESALIAAGRRLVAGVDEVGRGALAGPLGVAAVILDPARLPLGIDDSKVLSAARREVLFEKILETALACAIVFVSVEEIDRLNIRAATLAGMRRALQGLAIRPAYALIDGRDVPPGLPCPAEAIIAGDAKSVTIGAASILAKVMRDRLMRALDAQAPAYGFARHVGYGTAAHLAALRREGRSVHHRRSFNVSGL